MPVGCFENQCVLSMPGRFRYMPYRGPGHHEMQMALRNGQRPRCTISDTSFEIVECPEYGVLVLSAFVHGEAD